MLHHILSYSFDERVIRDRLNEDRSVVCTRCGRDVHLQRQRRTLLQQPVVNVFDGLEPGHLRIVDMVRLIVQHHQLVDVADDHAQVHFGVRGRTSRAGTEEVVHRVVILSGGRNVVSGIDTVDVR